MCGVLTLNAHEFRSRMKITFFELPRGTQVTTRKIIYTYEKSIKISIGYSGITQGLFQAGVADVGIMKVSR